MTPNARSCDANHIPRGRSSLFGNALKRDFGFGKRYL